MSPAFYNYPIPGVNPNPPTALVILHKKENPGVFPQLYGESQAFFHTTLPIRDKASAIQAYSNSATAPFCFFQNGMKKMMAITIALKSAMGVAQVMPLIPNR